MGARFLHLACQGDGSRPCPPIRDVAGDICGNVACITLFILWLCGESHNVVYSTAHICSKMYSSKHCS